MQKTSIRRTATVIVWVLAICILSTTAYAQRRPRLKPPPALLEVIDKDDLDCVKQTGLARSVTVRPIKLARHRPQQLLIRGSGLCLCGAQNCAFWIYQKTGARYELLLVGTGSTKVKAGRDSTYDYRDVISLSHASAAETIIRTYRYDGARYRLTRCLNRAFYDDNGQYTKRPTYRPCGEESKTETYVTLSSGLLEQQLPTIDNRSLKLSDYSDRITVVTLMASWCFPCLQTISEFDKISSHYSPAVQLIAVATPAGDPQVESLRRVAATRNLKVPLVWENVGFSNALSKLVGAPEALPQTFVLDQQGRIRKHFSGYNPANSPTLFREALDQIKSADSRQPPS